MDPDPDPAKCSGSGSETLLIIMESLRPHSFQDVKNQPPMIFDGLLTQAEHSVSNSLHVKGIVLKLFVELHCVVCIEMIIYQLNS